MFCTILSMSDCLGMCLRIIDNGVSIGTSAWGVCVYVTLLRSGEDPELQNTLKNASYRGGRAANCFNYSPTEGDGGVRAIRSSPG